MGIKGRKKKKQPIKVRILYPETAEGIEELRESQSKVMLDILEKQLGEEGLRNLIEYAKEKQNCKTKDMSSERHCPARQANG